MDPIRKKGNVFSRGLHRVTEQFTHLSEYIIKTARSGAKSLNPEKSTNLSNLKQKKIPTLSKEKMKYYLTDNKLGEWFQNHIKYFTQKPIPLVNEINTLLDEKSKYLHVDHIFNKKTLKSTRDERDKFVNKLSGKKSELEKHLKKNKRGSPTYKKLLALKENLETTIEELEKAGLPSSPTQYKRKTQ